MTPIFEKALSAEITSSEFMRVAVLAAILAFLLVNDQLLAFLAFDLVAPMTFKPVPAWMPLAVIGPFLAYELVVLTVVSYRRRRGLPLPRPVRFVNAAIETSLPTAIIWVAHHYFTLDIVLGTWPSLLYFIFIAASTLRLDFLLSAFTAAVAAIGYLGVVKALLPPDLSGTDPAIIAFYHGSKAAIMMLSGIVAGLVALRLRAQFSRALIEAGRRERLINLFGQHVSPAVLDRLLETPIEASGETRNICVMFLDIRDFTAHARERPPEDVVAYLNAAFAFMIEAIDRHGGVVNKFLGDGIMALFGAPLRDPAPARAAVAAALNILFELDRRRSAAEPWPLRVGIGLHAGPAVTGTIGSSRRKEYTAVGATVNLACRLEHMTKELNVRLLVSEAVIAALDGMSVHAISLGTVNIKGYDEPVKVWSLQEAGLRRPGKDA